MALNGNAASGIPAGSSLVFGSDLYSASKVQNPPPHPSGYPLAQGMMTLDSQTGNWVYQPLASEIPGTGDPDNIVCCRFELQSISCNCIAQFWICACIPAETDPCDDYPTQTKFFQKTCPFTPITADDIVSGAGGNWSSGAQILSVVPCSVAGVPPAEGTATINSGGQIEYVPAEGESGEAVGLCATVLSPDGACTILFPIIIQFNDYCVDFVINDVGP